MAETPDGTWQLIVHPAATDRLVSWLRSRGLDIAPFSSGEDDLPTYILAPSADTIAANPTNSDISSPGVAHHRHEEGS